MFTTSTKTRVLASVSLVIGLSAASPKAQSLSGRVVRNPNSTVTYTIHVDGPKRGAVFLAASTGLAPRPLFVPGIGTLHLDPLSAIPVGTFPLDANGHSRLDITVPAPLTNDVNVCFQAVVIGPLGLAATPFISAWQFEAGILALGPHFAGGYDRGNYNFKMIGLPAGASVGIAFNSTPKLQTKAKNGVAQGGFPMNRPPKCGDVLTIYVNGKEWKRYHW